MSEPHLCEGVESGLRMRNEMKNKSKLTTSAPSSKQSNAPRILLLFVFANLHPYGRVYEVFLGSLVLVCTGIALFSSSVRDGWVIGLAFLFLGLVFHLMHRKLLRAARKREASFNWLGLKEYVVVFLLCISGTFLIISTNFLFLSIVLFAIVHLICMWRINGVEILKLMNGYMYKK